MAMRAVRDVACYVPTRALISNHHRFMGNRRKGNVIAAGGVRMSVCEAHFYFNPKADAAIAYKGSCIHKRQ